MIEITGTDHSPLASFSGVVRDAVTDLGVRVINRYQRNIRSGGGNPRVSESIKQILQSEGFGSAVDKFVSLESQRHVPDCLLNSHGTIYQAARTVYEAVSVVRGTTEGMLMTLTPKASRLVAASQKDARDYYDPKAGGTYRKRKK